MSRFEGQVTDEYGRAVPGAKVYVYDQDGTYSTLTSNGVDALSQPVITDEFGGYSYYAADPWREDTWYGGKLRFRMILGSPQAALQAVEDDAEQIAGYVGDVAQQVAAATDLIEAIGALPTSGLSLIAANRTALAGLATDRAAIVIEAGRVAVFVFDAADHSADVTADPTKENYVAPSSDTTGASGAWVRQFGSNTLDLVRGSTATIASGAITVDPNNSFIAVATEGGAATDDLLTINGGTSGRVVILRASSSSQTITLKPGGNIDISTDIAFTRGTCATLIFDSLWHVVASTGVDSGVEQAISTLLGLVAIPAITGTPDIGQVLSGPGGWYSYQWNANGTPIPGATSSTYTITPNEAGKTMSLTLGLGLGLTRNTASVGPVTATLPTGAVGAWYMDTYSTSPRPNVPNAATATAVSANLYNAPRRLFNLQPWSRVSATVVDNAVTGPDGLTEASTVSFVGGGTLAATDPVGFNLPAGTYTIAVSVKRNTGTDQSFCFFYNTSTRSSVKTATSSWTDQSFTFTLGAPQTINACGLCTIDGTTAANLQICDFRLFSGSSDLGAAAPVGHLLPGLNAKDTRPAYASGELDLTASNAVAMIQLPSALSASSGFTVQAVVKKTAGAVNYEAALSKIQSFTEFAAWFNDNSGVPLSFGNGTFNATGVVGAGAQGAGLWDLLNKGYHVLTWRYDPALSREEIFLDDTRMFVRLISLTASIQDLWVNTVSTTAFANGRKYFGLALWNRALSDTEVFQGYAHWKIRAGLSSITVSGDTTDRLLIAEGDSISTNIHGASYVYQSGPNLSPVVLGSNFAITGSTLANLVTRAPFIDRVLLNGRGTKTPILSVLIGANDLGTYTGASDAAAAANYLAALASYCDARRTAGFKVVVCTILPIGSGTAHNARRAIVNAAITSSWVGVHCDAVADFAANATMGTDTSFTDHPTDWFDSIHPNAAGHTVLEPIFRAAVNSL